MGTAHSTPRISAYIIAYNEVDKIRDAMQTVLWGIHQPRRSVLRYDAILLATGMKDAIG